MDTESSTDTGSATDTDSAMDTDGIPDSEPPQPGWLTVDTMGNPNDSDVTPLGPGLLLAGGGDPLSPAYGTAYQWLASLVAGGDIVVLQSEGDPLLTGHLYDIGGADSVQTIIVPHGAVSLEPWIVWTIAHAEAVLIVGVAAQDTPSGLIWKDTPLETAIMFAWERGAVIGGLDAGVALLGEFVFPGYGEPLDSTQALSDPYDPDLMLDSDFLTLDPLAGALIEPRFANRDRMGRLLALTARVLEDSWSTIVVGIGVDEDTAMVIDTDRVGTVHGNGRVHVFRASSPAITCSPGQNLEFAVTVYHLAATDTALWPDAQTDVAGEQVIATMGMTQPLEPY